MSERTELVAGVDEAGRGPLAGPVVVAAVILDPNRPIAGLADSKALSAVRREELARQIIDRASAYAIVEIDAAQIDAMNILNATLEGMRRALAELTPAPTRAVIDGNRLPTALPCAAEAVVGGDALIDQISAASILAKVRRDGLMRAADLLWPEYGFARHHGYPTTEHRAALLRHGPCPLHRRSYAPVAEAIRNRAGQTDPDSVPAQR